MNTSGVPIGDTLLIGEQSQSLVPRQRLNATEASWDTLGALLGLFFVCLELEYRIPDPVPAIKRNPGRRRDTRARDARNIFKAYVVASRAAVKQLSYGMSDPKGYFFCI